MLEVFAAVDPAIKEQTFLGVFRDVGCYLEDLCPDPVDLLPRLRRRAACEASEALLAGKIAELRPRMIVTLVRSIEGNVGRAIAAANWNGPLLLLPYPGRWRHLRNQFAERLRPVVETLLRSGSASLGEPAPIAANEAPAAHAIRKQRPQR